MHRPGTKDDDIFSEDGDPTDPHVEDEDKKKKDKKGKKVKKGKKGKKAEGIGVQMGDAPNTTTDQRV